MITTTLSEGGAWLEIVHKPTQTSKVNLPMVWVIRVNLITVFLYSPANRHFRIDCEHTVFETDEIGHDEAKTLIELLILCGDMKEEKGVR